ncbi:MAG: hypothetical protein JWP11_629 [Frankiales bacterium]|nr:hypothetical protein [Frankiales bacterium]
MALRRHGRQVLLAVLAAAVTATPLLAAPAGAAAPGAVTTVMSGLDNPRGLAIGSDGRLYVAEAGHGGSDCPAGAKGPEGQPVCFGTTGAFTRVTGGLAIRLVRGLASIAGPDGSGAEGLSAMGQGAGGLWQLLMGLSTHATIPGLTAADTQTSNNQLGRLLSLSDTGTATIRADVGDADYDWSASHQSYVPQQFPDANPFAMLIEGSRTDVIDSGTNVLSYVDGSAVTQRAFFHNPAVGDSVPTCIARGPDKALYVGELTGGGNKPGSARVWRVVPNHSPILWRSGFTNMTGCGFDTNGNFYAVELQTTAFNPGPQGDPRGAVIKVAANGTRTRLGYGKLFYPQGFAVRDGGLYVSNWSLMPGKAAKSGQPTGQIVRIQL